jgi:VWFA-related protein
MAIGSESQFPLEGSSIRSIATIAAESSPYGALGQAVPDQQEQKPQGQSAISVAVDMVSLQALVTDKNGNVITGLQPEHFTVYEDGVRQEISNFAPVDANITVVMLVEYSKQISWMIYDVWNAIYGFSNSLRPGDWVAVIGYDIRPTILSDFTQDRMELNKALRRFNSPAFSESNLVDALLFTLERVEEIEGKVAIFLVSTGLDTFSKQNYDAALDACKYANASVFALGLGQSLRIRYENSFSGPQRGELLMADNRLRSFAELTGGEAFFPRFITEFPSIFNTISIMLRNQYSIGYVSSNTKKEPGKYRKIKVEVKVDVDKDGKPDKLKIHTRRGYKIRKS